jgi:hypothetical protein
MNLPDVAFFLVFWAQVANFLVLPAGKPICPLFGV